MAFVDVVVVTVVSVGGVVLAIAAVFNTADFLM